MEIKESLELMEGLKVLAIAAKKVGADGKVNMLDLPIILDLIQKASALIEAAKGAEAIPVEMKDLSQEEASQMLAKLFEILAAVKAA